jgi:hypothetical protein
METVVSKTAKAQEHYQSYLQKIWPMELTD